MLPERLPVASDIALRVLGALPPDVGVVHCRRCGVEAAQDREIVRQAADERTAVSAPQAVIGIADRGGPEALILRVHRGHHRVG